MEKMRIVHACQPTERRKAHALSERNDGESAALAVVADNRSNASCSSSSSAASNAANRNATNGRTISSWDSPSRQNNASTSNNVWREER